MLIPLSLKTLTRLVGVLTIFTTLYIGYSYIKNIGYQEAETKYINIIQEEKTNASKRIDALESQSSSLVKSNKVLTDSLSKDINSITSSLKGKTLTIVKDGECTPSKEFSDSIYEINLRTNQVIKDSQK